MNICIYGASSETIDQSYLKEMERLARMLAKEGHSLVFGGGNRGMMGAAARGFHTEGAKIIGVAPSFFASDHDSLFETDKSTAGDVQNQQNDHSDVLYRNCTQLILTDTMRERKQKMEEFSDVFLAAPGGIGTYDEFFEILTLRQLHQHEKQIILYNINGFYDRLLAFLEEITEKNFMRTEENIFHVCTTPEEVLKHLGKKPIKI